MFTAIRKIKDQLTFSGRKPERIIASTNIVRRYVFVVEKADKYYILVNIHDLHLAISRLPKKTIEQLSEHIMEIPYEFSNTNARTVMTGIFRGALSI